MPALQKKHKKSSVYNIKSVMNTRYGAGGGTRTHTVSLPTDFESVTSAIPSHRHGNRNIITKTAAKCKH